MTYPPRLNPAPRSAAGSRLLGFIGEVSGVVTVVAAGISLMWYVVSVEGRISRLEAQMQTFATAPTVTTRSPTTPPDGLPPRGGKPAEAKAAGTGDGSGLDLVLSQNPLQNACGNLIARAMDASRGGYNTDFNNLKGLMHDLGCDGLAAAAQKK